MYETKRISREAVPAALEKANRYRLLNEPAEAESICKDVLLVDPENQQAAITLLLAITDQFETKHALDDANDILQKLQGQYEQEYYGGIIKERWGKAQVSRGMPADFSLTWIRDAMRNYATAEGLSDQDDPDAMLRWNTCARFLNHHSETHKVEEVSSTYDVEASFGDDVPPR